MAIAHTKNYAGVRHDLVQHLRDTAQLAYRFGEAFGAGDISYWLALWHDIGKHNPAFQEYLTIRESGEMVVGPDHKAAGAWLADQHLGGYFAMIIAGHHGGLQAEADFNVWLANRAEGDRLTIEECVRQSRIAIPDLEPAIPPTLPAFASLDERTFEFFLRMVYSCVVDADYLDTERHFSRMRSRLRYKQNVIEERHWQQFERNQNALIKEGSPTLDQARDEIYQACLAAAELEPGFFRLSVPTGGGKTRSALGFALRHAMKHNLKRVIVAIPYLSITEQTTKVYRDIFEPEVAKAQVPVVLEHYSSSDAGKENENGKVDPRREWLHLAAENWDTPIVVTTTVQLFESLFASTPGRCRKLHNLAKSVIILDEAQMLPAHLLTPILDSLKQLCAHYGVSVVISTATQPDYQALPIFRDTPAREIVPAPERYFRSLKRVQYVWRTHRPAPWVEIAGWMKVEQQALAVLNTKLDALALLDALDDPDALHLSTLLCGTHRTAVLAEVKWRLANKQPCHLVSTQVVEAGVNLDFPLALRALGPLDSILQVGGRANREGLLERDGVPCLGRLIIFDPGAGHLPTGDYQTRTDITSSLCRQGKPDMNDPNVFSKYFQRVYGNADLDANHIQVKRFEFDYPRVAERFRMIEDESESVVVLYSAKDEQEAAEREHQKIRDLLAELAANAANAANQRELMRKLQPFTVAIRAGWVGEYTRRGLIAPVVPGLGLWQGKYHMVRGLMADSELTLP